MANLTFCIRAHKQVPPERERIALSGRKTKTVSDIGIFARIQNFWNLLRGSSDFTLSFSFYPEITFLILNNNIYNIEGK
jgi:hypothetical protein